MNISAFTRSFTSGLLLTALSCCFASHATERPDTMTFTPHTQHQTSVQNPLRLRHIHLLAAPQDISSHALEQALHAYSGQTITAELLQRILNQVTRYYRDLGYSSTQAYLPEQDILEGNLSVFIATSSLDNVQVKNTSMVRDSYMAYLLSSVSELEGTTINTEELNNRLLRFTDLGIFDIKGSFQALDESYQHNDLVLETSPAKDLLSFTAFADNEGNDSTGRYRFGGQVEITNVTGSADSLSLFYARTDKQQNNYSISYKLPVNSHPSVLGVNWCTSDYEVSGEFAELGAEGHSSTLELYWQEPLYRSSEAKLFVQPVVRYKDLNDSFTSFDLNFRKHSIGYGLTVGGFYKLNDSTLLTGSVDFTHSRLYADETYGTMDDFSFVTAHAQMQLLSSLSQHFSNTVTVEAQLANTTLDGSDQILLGGKGRLSGYDPSDLVGDSAVLIRDDLTYTTSLPLFDAPVEISCGPHIETARFFKHSQVHETASSGGFGTRLSLNDAVSLDFDVSEGLGSAVAFVPKETRVSFTALVRF